MILQNLYIEQVPWYLVYDEGAEGGEGGGGGGQSGVEGDTGNDPAGGKPPKTFTQEQVNGMLAEHKRNLQKQVQDTVAELERLKKSKGLSDKEKSELQTRIEELNNSLLTEKELAQKNEKKLRDEHKNQVDGLSADRDAWKKRYVDSTITRTITDEAIRAEAYLPSQIVTLLQGDTRLVEVLDAEGNVVPDKFIAKVKFSDTDKEGNPVTLDLTVPEALKRMKDRVQDYGNLFKSGVVSGLGGSGNRGASGKQVNPKDMTAAQWAEHRKTLGLGRKKGG